MSLVLLVLGVAGLTLLVVSVASVVWLVSMYQARLAQLEAQLARPCLYCRGLGAGREEEAL
jgi:hypothetical protein